MKQIALIFTLFISIFVACQSQRSKKMTIATAANMQFVIEELVQAFTMESGIECEIIVGSSGKLTAQISEGAPFDVFLSADMKYPNELFERNIARATPKVYAYGKLVLWSMMEDHTLSMEVLSSDKTTHIALSNPKTAPYGLAALEVLEHYGLVPALENKLVYGESISQTNQFVLTGAVEAGFTAKSVVVSSRLKGKGKWKELDNTFYTPIAQGVVLLQNRQDFKEEAQLFQKFLFSEKGKTVLRKFGYVTN